MDLVEVLSFFFMLSTMELGRVRPECDYFVFEKLISVQDYSTESLSETQKAMLEDLRDYGLVWQRKVRCREWNAAMVLIDLVITRHLLVALVRLV